MPCYGVKRIHGVTDKGRQNVRIEENVCERLVSLIVTPKANVND